MMDISWAFEDGGFGGFGGFGDGGGLEVLA